MLLLLPLLLPSRPREIKLPEGNISASESDFLGSMHAEISQQPARVSVLALAHILHARIMRTPV
jgi:hypothetical protein